MELAPGSGTRPGVKPCVHGNQLFENKSISEANQFIEDNNLRAGVSELKPSRTEVPQRQYSPSERIRMMASGLGSMP